MPVSDATPDCIKFLKGFEFIISVMAGQKSSDIWKSSFVSYLGVPSGFWVKLSNEPFQSEFLSSIASMFLLNEDWSFLSLGVLASLNILPLAPLANILAIAGLGLLFSIESLYKTKNFFISSTLSNVISSTWLSLSLMS